MELVGALRVKNEARWIRRVIDSIKGVCSRIYVMDDHSTDDTAAICADAGAVVMPSPFQGLHEARDKDWLICQLGKPDWVLMIDGDEVLEPNGGRKILEAIQSGQGLSYKLWIRYLWNSDTQIRVDGIYREFYRPSLWKFSPGQTFLRTPNGGGFHCSSVPTQVMGRCKRVPISLLHLGYRDREDRLRKYEWYNSIKPVPTVEDGYKHMVLGDILPAALKTRWAGPLQLQPLEALHA